MRHGSLFSGIGGFDLASEWMGWENVFHCEWNPFGQKVLNYYWPKAITYNDITKTDFTIHRGQIDIITGGFPCQPYSSAGKRLGKEDSRHLWPEMLRAIREIQPTWVVGENVRGLTNWNGGLVFDEVQSELETEGYKVTPFLLPAASVGAPHIRQRIWFVAYNATNSNVIRQSGEKHREKESEWIAENGKKSNATDSEFKGLQGCSKPKEVSRKKRTLGGKRDKLATKFASTNKESNATDSNSIRHEFRQERERSKERTQPNDKQFKRRNKLPGADFQMFPTQSPICLGDDGLSDRLDGITFSKWRNESIKAGGNAIVPQVVHQIFKAIQQYNDLEK